MPKDQIPTQAPDEYYLPPIMSTIIYRGELYVYRIRNRKNKLIESFIIVYFIYKISLLLYASSENVYIRTDCFTKGSHFRIFHGIQKKKKIIPI